MRAFPLFGVTHCTIIAITLLVPLILAWWVRKKPAVVAWLNPLLAVILLSSKPMALWLAWQEGNVGWDNALPMHLCDWAVFLAAIALFRPKWQGVYECAYFWGLAGTMQAILTPDITVNFPHPRFITFFLSHCGIVVVVLYMTWGLRETPRPWSWLKVWGWTVFYIGTAGLVNFLVGANYGYLCRKPSQSSIMDYMGDWPYYILVILAIAMIKFLIFYAPFGISRWLNQGKL